MSVAMFNKTSTALGAFGLHDQVTYGRNSLSQSFSRVLADKTNTQPENVSRADEGKKKPLKGRATELTSSENVAPSSQGKKPKKKRAAKKVQTTPLVASTQAKAATNAFFGYAQGATPVITPMVQPKDFAAALRIVMGMPQSTSKEYVKFPTAALADHLDVEDIITEVAPVIIPETKVEIPAPQVSVIVPSIVPSDARIAPKASLLARLVLRVTSIAKAIICLPLNALVLAKTSIVYTSTKTIQFCQNIFKFRRNTKIEN